MRHTRSEESCLACKLNRLHDEWKKMSSYNQLMLGLMVIEIALLIIIVVQGFL